MNKDEIKWDGIGLLYAVVAGRQLTFEGDIHRGEKSIIINDFRTSRLVELAPDTVKQIIWRSV